jgi:hypothetical protein
MIIDFFQKFPKASVILVFADSDRIENGQVKETHVTPSQNKSKKYYENKKIRFQL